MYIISNLQLYKVRVNFKLNDKAVHIMSLLETFFLTCSHMSISAGTVLLITCAAKLYIKFQVPISHIMQQTIHHILFVNFIQYVCPSSRTSKSLSIYNNSTSCLRKRLRVHLRKWGGSNTVAVSWSWNLKKSVITETPNCFKALAFLAPRSQQLPILHCGIHQ
jgi:hypothetical protein